MTKWKRSIPFVCAVALILLSSVGWAEGPETFELPAPHMGTVTFPHAVHQTRVENCEVCHHKGVENGACPTCHAIVKTAPQGKDLFHRICRECHKEQGGPTDCAGCHTRPAVQ